MNIKNYVLIALMITNAIVFAQSSNLPIVKGTSIQKGVKYISQSGKHYLHFQQDGNLVVMTASDKKVWGLNEVYSNYSQVSNIKIQDDGNLVASNSSDKFLWSALTKSNPAAQLLINDAGVLQFYGAGNKVLWSSNGDLTSKGFVIDYGWTSYRLLADPKIIIMGSRAVTPIALDKIANVYTEMTQRLTATYPKNSFDGYIIYVTNGEPWSELEKLSPIGTMWPDKEGKSSGDFLRGGTSPNYLWIDEQMICKTGIKTRNDAFAAGTLNEGDNTVRTYDQVVHEFGHAIDFKFDLRSRILDIYKGGWEPVEQFPWSIQYWFSTPAGTMTEKERAFMAEIFTEQTTFSCSSYHLKSELTAEETLKAGEGLISPNGKYRLSMQPDGNLCTYKFENGTAGVFTWGSYQSKSKYPLGANYSLVMQKDGNLCIVNDKKVFRWGSLQTKKYSLAPGSKLVLTNAGKLNILNSRGEVVWVN